MSTSASLERRKHQRISISMAMEVRDQNGFLLLSTRDLSSGGAFFDRSIPRPVGQRVELRFTLPGDTRAIRCEGEIANVPDAQGYGMGIRFLNLSPADEKRIDELGKTLRDTF